MNDQSDSQAMTTPNTNPTTDAGNIVGTPELTKTQLGFVGLIAMQNPEKIIALMEAKEDLERQLTQSREATVQAEKHHEVFVAGIANNIGACGACAEIIFCGYTLAEHRGCAVADLSAARAELTDANYLLAKLETHAVDLGQRLAAETAKNAELQGYVRKLANLLGCTDGDDSPELGIKEMLADRAALREKVAKAERALEILADPERWILESAEWRWIPNFDAPIIAINPNEVAAVALADLRGNDKEEKGA